MRTVFGSSGGGKPLFLRSLAVRQWKVLPDVNSPHKFCDSFIRIIVANHSRLQGKLGAPRRKDAVRGVLTPDCLCLRNF